MQTVSATEQPRSDHKITGDARDRRIGLAICRVAMGYALAMIAALSWLQWSPTGWFNLNAEQHDPLFVAVGGHVALLTVFMLLWRYRRRAEVRRPRAPLVLLTFLIMLLVSGELILAVVFPPLNDFRTIYQRHPDRGWTPIPNKNADPHSARNCGKPARFDRHGLRVAETGPIKTDADGYRMLFVGDSVTFGWCLLGRETYPAQTVAALQRHQPDLRPIMLNAGVVGYDTFQEFHRLEHDLKHIAPDMVIWQICLNDVSWRFDPARPFDVHHEEAGQAMPPTHWTAYGRAAIHFGQWLRFGNDAHAAARATELFGFAELMRDPPTRRAIAAWERTLKLLDKARAIAAKRDWPFVLVYCPIRSQLTAAQSAASPQHTLARYAHQRGVAYLDLQPVLRAAVAVQDEHVETIMFDETHLTAAGARVTGEAVAAFLVDQKLASEADGGE